jgi:hypothetical protein
MPTRRRKHPLPAITRAAYVAQKSRLRHAITFTVRCDLVSLTADDRDRHSVTISSPANDRFPGLLWVQPHTATGKKICATFQRDQVVHFDLGGNTFSARVGCKGTARGAWLHAHGICSQLIGPVYVVEDDDPRFFKLTRRGAKLQGSPR